MANDSGRPVQAMLVLPDGTEHPIPAEGLTIGRRADIGLMIDDPSVSRRHAEIVFRGNAYCLSDLGSSNGTLLNRAPVANGAPLSDGDELQFGDAAVTFRLRSSVPQAKPPSIAVESPAAAEPAAPVIAVTTSPQAPASLGSRASTRRLLILASDPVAGPTGASVEVRLSGVLDIESTEQFKSETQRLADGGARHFVFELGGLDYVDSAGLSALVALHRTVSPQGGSVCLKNLQPAVRGIVELTRLNRVFTVQ
jgi:anti-anti-sigma factor